MRIGELFAGYGGLGMGVQAAIGGEVVWTSEIDEAACRVLDARLGVPNLGDITAVDWTSVPPVDVLTGGFPCQDVSLAGNRAGLAHGTRSGLWSYFADAIRMLRPRLVVIENVRGLLSAPADGDVEPCPWCLGDAGDEHHLRALGAVLGDLADLGYDARWVTVPASAVDAAHKRERVFIVAWPADADSAGSQGPLHALGQPAQRGDAAGDAAHRFGQRRRGPVEPEGGHEARGAGRVAQNADDQPRGQRREPAPGEAEGGRPRADAGGRGRASAGDPSGIVQSHEQNRSDAAGQSIGTVDRAEHRDSGGHSPEGVRELGRAAAELDLAADADSAGVETCSGRSWAGDAGRLQPVVSGVSDWGPYAPAITRWERAVGRPAPRPVEPSTKGTPVLSARFVEWLMGLPEGWVTDLCTRREALKMLGNGVVPQQAAYAVRVLLGRDALRAAA